MWFSVFMVHFTVFFFKVLNEREKEGPGTSSKWDWGNLAYCEPDLF